MKLNCKFQKPQKFALRHIPPTMRLVQLQLSDIMSLGPASLIAEYDGGCNFLYMGTLTHNLRSRWPLRTETRDTCVIASPSRFAELPLGAFRTRCLIRGLVRSVEKQEWDHVQWIVSQLPSDHALHSDKLTSAVLQTGVVSAIRYTIGIAEIRQVARPIFRIAAVDAVCNGHVDAAKYLCSRFTDRTLRQNVAMAASQEGDTALVKWCAENTLNSGIPSDVVRSLVYRGNVDALEWLRQRNENSVTVDQLVLYGALGGHLEAVDWALDNTDCTYNMEEICLMVCVKGLLGMLRHLVETRSFHFKADDCLRFAKKGSGISRWLTKRR